VQRMPSRKAHTISMTQYSPFLLSLDPSFWDFNETYEVKVKHKSEDERGHQTGYHFKDISITKGFFFFFPPHICECFQVKPCHLILVYPNPSPSQPLMWEGSNLLPILRGIQSPYDC
jgi:hypothetical protein